MSWNIHYDICAVAINFVMLILFKSKKSYPSTAAKLYLVLLLTALCAGVFDILSVFMISNVDRFPIGLSLTITSVYYIAFNAVPYLYFVYVVCIIWKIRPVKKWILVLVGGLAIVNLGLVLSNPVTKWLFYYDENKNYCTGPMKPLVFVIIFCILLMCLYQTRQNRLTLDRMQCWTVYFFTAANITAVVIQWLYPEGLILNFTIALALMLIYMSLQNPEDFIDNQTQIYNQTAFVDVVNGCMNGYLKKRHRWDIIVLKLHAFHQINETAGLATGNVVIRKVAEYLKTIAPNQEAYRISGVKFAILVHSGKNEVESILWKIQGFFEKPLQIGKMEFEIKPLLCTIQYPDHVKSQSELEATIQYCIKQLEEEEGKRIIYANEDTVQQIRREQEITDILRRAVERKSFEVYYQPIHNVHTGRYNSAEALIRLFDDEYGFIPPDEFIPIAEKNGLIMQIGDYVFEMVCCMITQSEIARYGIEYIEVNLSAVQCIQKDLIRRLDEIRERYNVPARMINLEITETATIQSSEQLKVFMNKMNEEGITFSLDDYGSGLALINYLIQYPFSYVKLDKEIVWAAFKQEKAAIILKHTIEMMKALNLHIIAEGVETTEQAEGLARMGCDYFQGYLYAKPMPQATFLMFLIEELEQVAN